jgi:hypothetical protein
MGQGQEEDLGPARDGGRIQILECRHLAGMKESQAFSHRFPRPLPGSHGGYFNARVSGRQFDQFLAGISGSPDDGTRNLFGR